MADGGTPPLPSPGLAVVVFGVSGCGKTTIGRLIAEQLRCDFLDADDFHPKNNIDKMRSGIPLSDTDRRPWLDKLKHTLASYLIQRQQVVLACSALKKSYRDILREAGAGVTDPSNTGNRDAKLDSSRYHQLGHLEMNTASKVVFVHLKVSELMILARIEARFKRGDHYMPPSLLKSQLAVLEAAGKLEQGDVVTVDSTAGGDARAAAAEAMNKLASLLKSP